MKKILWNLLLLVCAVLFCISTYKIFDHLIQNYIGKHNTEELRSLAVYTESEDVNSVKSSEAEEKASEENSEQQRDKPKADAVEKTESELKSREKAPIAVDFTALKSACQDVVGWLYCPDTPINYPLAQSRDNDYYLDHMTDGSYNTFGTIFLDYRSSGDFSDPYSVVYGHNMNNDTMFGSLDLYKNQSYYDEHPVLYLLTPESAYRVDLAAGLVIAGNSDIYSLPMPEENIEKVVSEALTKSTFSTSSVYDKDKKYLVLSTCSYEFNEARYVLIGEMTEISPR